MFLAGCVRMICAVNGAKRCLLGSLHERCRLSKGFALFEICRRFLSRVWDGKSTVVECALQGVRRE